MLPHLNDSLSLLTQHDMGHLGFTTTIFNNTRIKSNLFPDSKPPPGAWRHMARAPPPVKNNDKIIILTIYTLIHICIYIHIYRRGCEGERGAFSWFVVPTFHKPSRLHFRGCEGFEHHFTRDDSWNVSTKCMDLLH